MTEMLAIILTWGKAGISALILLARMEKYSDIFMFGKMEDLNMHKMRM